MNTSSACDYITWSHIVTSFYFFSILLFPASYQNLMGKFTGKRTDRPTYGWSENEHNKHPAIQFWEIEVYIPLLNDSVYKLTLLFFLKLKMCVSSSQTFPISSPQLPPLHCQSLMLPRTSIHDKALNLDTSLRNILGKCNVFLCMSISHHAYLTVSIT